MNYNWHIPKLHDLQLLLFAHKVVHNPEKLYEIFSSYFEFNNTFYHT